MHACVLRTPTGENVDGEGIRANVGVGNCRIGQRNGRGIYCNAPSDSALPHGSTTTLNVHGYEPSGQSAYSRACVQYYNTSGTSCGSYGYWGSGYSGAYGVSTSSWTSNGSGMPYVYNYIPSGGRLHGFYMAN